MNRCVGDSTWISLLNGYFNQIESIISSVTVDCNIWTCNYFCMGFLYDNHGQVLDVIILLIKVFYGFDKRSSRIAPRFVYWLAILVLVIHFVVFTHFCYLWIFAYEHKIIGRANICLEQATECKYFLKIKIDKFTSNVEEESDDAFMWWSNLFLGLILLSLHQLQQSHFIITLPTTALPTTAQKRTSKSLRQIAQCISQIRHNVKGC